MQDRREQVKRAVTRLVEDEDADRLFDSLTTIIRVTEANPLPEDLAILVALAVSEPAVYAGVLGLIEGKRAALGLDPLVPPPEPERFEKTSYQREFMAQKRARQYRAAQIENDSRPARAQLIGRARLDFMDNEAAKWKRELDELVAKAREAHGGGRVPKEVLQTLRDQFWAGIDKRLDDLEEQVRRRKL